MKKHLLLSEAAKEVGVKPYQLSYAISSGQIPEPELRINNHRVFDSRHDLPRIQKYFAGKKSVKKEDHANS